MSGRGRGQAAATGDDAEKMAAGHNKGLRQFSRQVWMKVMSKKKTTYNEVADELVEEFRAEQAAQRVAAGLTPQPVAGELQDDGKPANPQLDERNVRRRVYDALNVLMAMSIIVKQKKDIIWKGLPSNNADEVAALESEYERRKNSLLSKRRQVRDLILQQLSFRRLVQRNKIAEAQARASGMHLLGAVAGADSNSELTGSSSASASSSAAGAGAGGDAEDQSKHHPDNKPYPRVAGRASAVIHLPFLTLSTPDTATIYLDIDAPYRREARATFDAHFVVHDEREILRQMRLHEFSESELKRFVPDHLHKYVLHPIRDESMDEAGAAAGAGSSSSAAAGSGSGGDGSGPRGSSSAAATTQQQRGTAKSAGADASSSGASAAGDDGAAAGGAGGDIIAAAGASNPLLYGASLPAVPGFVVSSGDGSTEASAMPALELCPGVTVSAAAAKDVACRLAGSVGMPPVPAVQAAVGKGLVPALIAGMNTGAAGSAAASAPAAVHSGGLERAVVESLITGAISSLGGLISDKAAAFVGADKLSSALQATAIGVAKSFGSSSADGVSGGGGAAAAAVSGPVLSWVSSLLQAVASCILQSSEGALLREQLSTNLAVKNELATSHRAVMQELQGLWQGKMNAQTTPEGQASVLAEYRAAQAAKHGEHQSDWAALVSKQRALTIQAHTNLALHAVSLLARGWMPDATSVEGAMGRAAASSAGSAGASSAGSTAATNVSALAAASAAIKNRAAAKKGK